MLSKKICTSLAVVCASALLTGCFGGSSSSSGVSAASYVKSICNAVGPFERDVITRSSALNLAGVKDANQGKAALQSFLNSVAGDTDSAVAKLQAAGTPNVSNGKAISSSILNAFAQLKGAMHTAAAHANSLPTNSPQAFQSAATGLGTTVRSSMQTIGASLSASNLKSSVLQKAAASEPACKSMGGA
jgi:hypothetical protein